MMHAPAMAHYLDHEVYPGIDRGQTDDELLDIARTRHLDLPHDGNMQDGAGR